MFRACACACRALPNRCASASESRLAHALIHTFGMAFMRTIAFIFGFGAQAVLFLRQFASI